MVLICSVGAEHPIQVRGDDNYPPYEFLDSDGQPSGFNVDLFRAIAKTMGINATISLGPWNKVRSELENGSIDALTGMYYSPERAQKVLFSNPHILVSHAIFVRKGSNIKGVKDLRDVSIIVQEGDIMHDYALNITDSSHIIPVRDQIDALILLSSGKYGAALLNKLQASYHLKNLKIENIEAIGPPIEVRNYSFAVSEGNDNLLQQLNEGLAIVKVNGEYNDIYQKWFGNPPQEITWEQIAGYLVMVLVPAGVIAGLLLLWLWSLKHQVREKTREIREELKYRKQIESDLRKSEFRNKQLLTAIPDLIFVLKKDGTYLDFHASDPNRLAIPADQIIGKNIKDIGLSEDSLDRILAMIDTTLESADMQQFEYILDLSGRNEIFEARMVPLEEERVLTIVRDITEKREIEEKLEKLVNFQKQMLDTAAFWIVTIDTEGRVTFWNHAAEKISGYRYEDVAGTSHVWDWIRPGHQSEKEILRFDHVLLQNEQLNGFETGVICKDGEYRTISWHSRIMRNQRGDSTGIIALGVDITKEKEIEEKVAAAVIQINHIMEILSILNDQIRNPLTIIAILIEDLEDEKKLRIEEQIMVIDKIIDKLDIGLLESEKVRHYLLRHYDIPESGVPGKI